MKKLFWVSIALFFFLSCISNTRDEELTTELYNIGNAFFDINEYDKAEDYYNRVLKNDPEFHKARYNLIHIYIYNSDFVTAEKHITFLNQMDVENRKIRNLWAYLQYNKGNLAEALELYNDLYIEGDNSNSIMLNIAKINYQLEQYKESLVFIDKLLMIQSSIDLYFMGGILATKLGDNQMAISYYESCINLGSEESDLYLNLSDLYLTIGDNTNLKKILLLMTLKGEDTNKADSFFRLAKISLLSENNFSEGYGYLEDAINLGFKSSKNAFELLESPNLIERDKVRELFIDNAILAK